MNRSDPWSGGPAEGAVWFDPPPRAAKVPGPPPSPARPPVALSVDGREVRVPAGATVLDACRVAGVETPTLCFHETLTPVNACRVCVVEVAGARTLVPACSRQAEAGMQVKTDTPRVRCSRKVVLELLASSVDLRIAPGMAETMARYGASPGRFGPPAPDAADRDAREAGHHHAPDGAAAETVAQPVKADNDCYVRDYSKCVLCYRCVEACGTDAQNTFAIAVAGRGFDARISTEWARPLTDSACVYCGNCVAVCPTGALMGKTEHDLRAAGAWDPERQTCTDTICPYCGVGCSLSLTVQDGRIVRAASPVGADITRGNLCIKGRFGWGHVQPGPRAGDAP
ncbi:MAG: 2Fe-2S iron-sulfur cluster-binding protein [Planctomycetales bacterium]|nr:2Fe-2S iron-sulfur cluster-binding protein [Planctomycetales bacterium]